MIEQRELTGERLAREILALARRRSRRRRMARSRAIVWRGRTPRDVIVDEVLELAK